jgi:predicted house-cleaning NTP pyrophosphatase (Maf/HAM1 superfamily)
MLPKCLKGKNSMLLINGGTSQLTWLHYFSLSGTQHEVITGLSLHYKNKNGLYQEKLISETTRVKFSKLSSAVIHAYVETGEPL